MIIYLLAGLGFDKRSFQHLQWKEGVEIHHLDWIDPLSYTEPIGEYAARMLDAQIAPEHRNQELTFVGHSFGGVLSQELALLVEKPAKVILISSIKSHREKPLWMRLLYWLPVYWMISKMLIWLTYRIWSPWYGYKTAESRRLLWDMAARFSNRYHRWSTRCISHWRPKTTAKAKSLQLLSIHGSRDLMFPCGNISEPKRVVKGGNHFMVFHEAAEVSDILNSEL